MSTPRISGIHAWIEEVELSRPYTIAFRTVGDVRLGFVEVRTDTGLLGLGCASPEPHVTGETWEACAEALDPAGLQWLLGADVRELPRHARELARHMSPTPAARAALDMALHDCLGQHWGLPLVDVLGRAHEALPTSITIGIKPTEEALTEADEYLGRGFKVLKVKLGQSLDDDLERLRRLRGRVGSHIRIRVDPNQGYSGDDVLAFVEATEDLGIEFLEQPMAADRVDAMRDLPEAVRARLAADESLLDEGDALALLAPPRACGIFNIKLMKCGGIHAARRIAEMADVAGVELMWGCMDESVVSIAAALHAALASPATRYLDLDGSLDLARDLAEGGFVIEDGLMRVTGAPGLGVRRL